MKKLLVCLLGVFPLIAMQEPTSSASRLFIINDTDIDFLVTYRKANEEGTFTAPLEGQKNAKIALDNAPLITSLLFTWFGRLTMDQTQRIQYFYRDYPNAGDVYLTLMPPSSASHGYPLTRLKEAGSHREG